MSAPNVLLAAKPFGFGSAAKAVAVARTAPWSCELVACGGAADFGEKNADCLRRVIRADTRDQAEAVRALHDADAVVSVRDPDVVLAAARSGLPAFYLDSLLWFWETTRPLEAVAATARAAVSAAGDERAAEIFGSLTSHERAVAGHVLAVRSYAQNFPGVGARVDGLQACGVSGVRVAGPLVAGAPVDSGEGGGYDAVVSMGGSENFFPDPSWGRDYAALVDEVVEGLVAAGARSVLVCGGNIRRETHRHTASVPVTYRWSSAEELARAIASARIVMCSPGLTTLVEVLSSGNLPLLIPEQHYGHWRNADALERSPLRPFAIRLADVCAGASVPPGDEAGTHAIRQLVRDVLADPELRRTLRAVTTSKVEAFERVARSGGLDQAVDSTRALFAGMSLRDIISDIEQALTGGGPWGTR